MSKTGWVMFSTSRFRVPKKIAAVPMLMTSASSARTRMSNAAGFPGLGRRFHLFRHGREHIDSALVMY